MIALGQIWLKQIQHGVPSPSIRGPLPHSRLNSVALISEHGEDAALLIRGRKSENPSCMRPPDHSTEEACAGLGCHAEVRVVHGRKLSLPSRQPSRGGRLTRAVALAHRRHARSSRKVGQMDTLGLVRSRQNTCWQVLVKRLRQDVAEWSQELHRLEEACRREEKAAGREEAEVQKLETERGHLMQQLDLSQRQLAELRLEHRRHQESALLISGVRKQQEEAFFLQRLREEYSRDSEAMEVSLTKLELASLSMEGQGRALQQATQEVHEQAKAEQARLDVEKRELQALQKALLSLRSTPPSPSAPTPGFGGDWDSPFGSTPFSGVGPEAWSSGVSLVDDSPWRRSPAGAAGVPTFRDGV
ncbi:BCHE [Symbiodinium sp. CCMP2592]|nr:BCHE [Symbiodinium sp. CCMP2592]